MLMLKIVSLITQKVLNENEFHYSVLKSSCYQLLYSGNQKYGVPFKKIDVTWP